MPVRSPHSPTPVLVRRALEFIAIRADITDDAEDRVEFETDTQLAKLQPTAKCPPPIPPYVCNTVQCPPLQHRALEFIAIRADITDDAEDRAEFEADTVAALIRLLSGGATHLNAGRSAAGRAALLGKFLQGSWHTGGGRCVC